MDLNLTLVGQMITFAVFIVFTMKFVWPPLMRIMDERRKKIADGLAAAEQGHNELELAHVKSKEIVTEARAQASHIVEQANQRANHIVEEAKNQARTEGDRLLTLARDEIEQQYNAARDQLTQQVANLAIAGAEKILQKEVDRQRGERLVNDMMGQL
jgi:F-type H+-transporting ATPase subunit b